MDTLICILVLLYLSTNCVCCGVLQLNSGWSLVRTGISFSISMKEHQKCFVANWM